MMGIQSWKVRHIGRVLIICLLAAGVVAVGSPTEVAHAGSCYAGYCAWHAEGYSGVGAGGTTIQVQIPTVVATYGTYDGIAFSSFIMDNYNYDESIEDGVVFGWADSCGKEKAYFFPYGTRDNGGTEVSNCGINLPAGGNVYWMRAYVINGQAYSVLQNSSYGQIWAHGWGSYGMHFGWNLTQAEVHADYGDTMPYWAGSVDMFHGQWLDGNGNWNFWGYTDTSDDCPYKATYYSPDAWQASSSC